MRAGTLLIALAVISFVLGWMFKLLLQYYEVVDHPGQRRMHTQPIVRGGGLAIVAVVLGYIAAHDFFAVSKPWLLMALCSCAITGFIDDIKPLSALAKLLLLTFATSLAVGAVGMPDWTLSAGFLAGVLAAAATHMPWLAAALAALAVLWLINLFNFMDGSHGLAAGQAIVSFAGLLLFSVPVADQPHDLTMLTAVALVATLGFLPWNFPRARMFLGDVGSLTLGLLLAILLLAHLRAGRIEPMTAVLLPAVFIVDSTATLLLRLYRGRNWLEAHTDHAYQRLLVQGWSHVQVWMLYMGLNLLLVWPLLLGMQMFPRLDWLIALLALLLLSAGWWLVQQRSVDGSGGMGMAIKAQSMAQSNNNDAGKRIGKDGENA